MNKLKLFFVAFFSFFTIVTNAITLKVGETETLDIGNVSYLQGCQWTISRPNDVVFVTTPQSYTTKVTIKAVNAFSGSPCVVQCKYYYLDLDPTTGRYTYLRTGYKDWNVFVKDDENGGGASGGSSSDDSYISLKPSEISVEVGFGSEYVYATGTYSGNLTWSIDCMGKIASFAEMSNDKVWCYGHTVGITYLRATCSNGKQAVCKINVVPKGSTLINNIKVDNKSDIDIYYNLQGQRVASPQRGSIYIKNGKKIIYP